jgi:hypothetical protein
MDASSMCLKLRELAQGLKPAAMHLGCVALLRILVGAAAAGLQQVSLLQAGCG